MEDIIDKIYEAAVAPDHWPKVLGAIADRFDTRGGLLFAASRDATRWVGAGPVVDSFREFVAQGWMAKNDRIPRMAALRHAGFVTDTDVYSLEEIASLPMYTEQLVPAGVFAGAATMVAGATDDSLVLSIEGFKSHDEARSALPILDALRPHLARSAMLASQLRLERARAAVAALEVVGAPAAFVSLNGALRIANARFEKTLGVETFDFNKRLRFAGPKIDQMFEEAIAALRTGVAAGRSIPLPANESRARSVLHILPLRGVALDVFTDGGAILVIGGLPVHGAPNAELLQALFDLTPAEARLARALVGGASLSKAAQQFGVTQHTARGQLKSLFGKTGLSRQIDLIRLLDRFGLPANTHGGA